MGYYRFVQKAKIKNVQLSLSEVEYKNTYFFGGYKDYLLEDFFEVSDVNFKTFVIDHVRILKFEKNENFILKIIVRGVFYFEDDEKVKSNFKNVKKLKEEINECCADIFNLTPSGNFVANLIANITGSFGNFPIITPPIFEKVDKQ